MTTNEPTMPPTGAELRDNLRGYIPLHFVEQLETLASLASRAAEPAPAVDDDDHTSNVCAIRRKSDGYWWECNGEHGAGWNDKRIRQAWTKRAARKEVEKHLRAEGVEVVELEPMRSRAAEPSPYPETSKRLGDYAQALGILSAIHPGIDTARIASAPVECAREIIDFVAKERRAPRDDGLRKAIVLVEGMQTDAIDEMRDYSQGSEDRRDLQLESNTLAIVAEKLRKLLAESHAADAGESTPRDDGRMRKLRDEVLGYAVDCERPDVSEAFSLADVKARAWAYRFVVNKIDKLLAESPASDATLSVEREYEAMVKLIRETHNGYNPEARKSMGIEEPESAIVALHELVKEQKSLEGYEIRDLRTRLQAVETERDAMAKERDEANAKTLRELEASREHMLNSLNWKHQRDELRAAQPQPAATSEPLRESATIVRPATVRQGDEDDEKSCPYCGRSNRFHDTDCETAHVWKHFDARLRALEGQ